MFTILHGYYSFDFYYIHFGLAHINKMYGAFLVSCGATL